jgi:predicted DsbA family dithiol-disulfide isomerase
VPVKVRWLPFQLNPTMPEEGISRREYRIKKFGSWERSQELDAKVVAGGKEEGIDFAFDRIERTPNTLRANRRLRSRRVDSSSRCQSWPSGMAEG